MLSRGRLTRWGGGEVPSFDIREPRNDGDFYVGLGIRFLFLIEYSHRSDVLISMEVAILGHVSFGWVRLHLRWPS